MPDKDSTKLIFDGIPEHFPIFEEIFRNTIQIPEMKHALSLGEVMMHIPIVKLASLRLALLAYVESAACARRRSHSFVAHTLNHLQNAVREARVNAQLEEQGNDYFADGKLGRNSISSPAKSKGFSVAT